MTNADRISQWANVPLPLAQLVVIGADRFGLSVKQVRSNTRLRTFYPCRKWICVEARKRGYSYPVIGRAMNRDHTTVMWAVGALRK